MSLLLAIASISLVAAAGAPPPPTESSSRQVTVNGARQPDERLASFAALGLLIADGRYWYDSICGAWGFEGGPTAGYLAAGLDFGAPLEANASLGTTGVFVNGRNLPMLDLIALQSLVGGVPPGRYRIDATGNLGLEGGPPLVNLVQLVMLARMAAQAQGQADPWAGTMYGNGGAGGYTERSGITGIGAGSDGTTSYVIGDGFSVIVD